MKSSKIERIVSVVVIGICLIKAVLYGGSKPPATTNTPPGDVSCPTNTVGVSPSTKSSREAGGYAATIDKRKCVYLWLRRARRSRPTSWPVGTRI